MNISNLICYFISINMARMYTYSFSIFRFQVSYFHNIVHFLQYVLEVACHILDNKSVSILKFLVNFIVAIHYSYTVL